MRTWSKSTFEANRRGVDGLPIGAEEVAIMIPNTMT